MSSIVLPSRGQCIQITDGIQRCQCLWFFPPGSLLLDQDICGVCGHGIHAHADYISTVVNHYPENRCTAYAQTTRMMQFCTCGAQFCAHTATYNPYQLPESLTVLSYFNPDGHASSAANIPFFPNTPPSSNYGTAIFSGHATDIPSPFPSINPSYPHGDTIIGTATPQPIVELTVPQIEARSHLEVENSYGVQYQDDDFSINVQDSHERFHRDYAYSAATDDWAVQLN